MDTTIVHLLTQLFPRDAVLDWARSTGAVRRLRDIHPADLVCALVSGAMGDEERSIATIRRMFDRIAGFMPEESSFYTRFNEGLALLMRLLWLRALSRANRTQRKRLARVLGVKVKDLRVVDATQASLPSWARDEFPSTHKVLGGFKLTATMSLLDELLVSAHLTDARRHDRKAFELPEDIQGVLYLFDRGYCDHQLFHQIAKSGGFFLGRLKSSSVPRLTRVRSGLGKAHIGERLDSFLPYRGIVDVDAEFNIGGGRTATFRMVSVPVRQRISGRTRTTYVDLVTNLSPTRFSAAAIGEMYRLRFAVETLFKILKTVGRLDQLRSGNRPVIEAFAFAALLGMTLAHSVCAAMREKRPDIEPSPHRVALLTLAYLPRFLAVLGTKALAGVVEQFINALWREGRNPNPGRRYATSRHIISVEKSR